MNSELSATAASDIPAAPRMPPGVRYAYGFVLMNAISFNIVLGAPVILYAKELGASATILGIISALTPLLTIFQIPAARYIEHLGYKRFMLFGWSIRVVFIFFLALIPLLGFLDAPTKVALVLCALFMFNLFRGISSGAWLPWITEIIPESLRSRYLAMDHIFLHLGGFLSMILAGLILGGAPSAWQFAAIFLLGAVTGHASLIFIRRMPEGASPDAVKRSGQQVPWKTIVFYPPFFTLVIFNLIFLACAGSLGVFSIAYLKTWPHFPESTVLYVSSFGWLGALITYPFIGPILDHTGSRPLLKFALLIMALFLLAWCAMAAHLLPTEPALIIFLNLIWGFAAANFNLANARLMMAVMPEMGRSHFYAFFSVITSLGLAVVPIAWGLVIDAIGIWSLRLGSAELNRFSLYFAGVALCAVGAAFYARALPETKVGRLDSAVRTVIIDASLRRLQRLWQR